MASSDSEGSNQTWVDNLLSEDRYKFLCRVDQRYMEDNFNLYGLRAEFPLYSECIGVIRSNREEMNYRTPKRSILEDCINLYGLIHFRYVQTAAGLEAMRHKYLNGEFGWCPQTACMQQRLIPCGIDVDLRSSKAVGFCARCENIYSYSHLYPYINLDGAYFGPSFAHLFFLKFTDLVPNPPASRYVPRIYGYRIHSTSKGRHHGEYQEQSEDEEDEEHQPPPQQHDKPKRSATSAAARGPGSKRVKRAS